MARRKLEKFADLHSYSNVYEYGYAELSSPEVAEQIAGGWSERAFDADRPLILELGCGRGEYTVALAQQDVTHNYIGVDRKGARMWHGATEALERGISNAAFLRTDINLLPLAFAPGEVSELWITFPDPQMKRTRARLLSSAFFASYNRYLKPDGLVHLKTDSTFLYEYTLSLLEVNGIEPIVALPDLYQEEQVLTQYGIPRILTHYEKQWLGRGKVIKYIRLALPVREQWLEPACEPEHDDYTSWSQVPGGLLHQVEQAFAQEE